jgi:hypothetical protein
MMYGAVLSYALWTLADQSVQIFRTTSEPVPALNETSTVGLRLICLAALFLSMVFHVADLKIREDTVPTDRNPQFLLEIAAIGCYAFAIAFARYGHFSFTFFVVVAAFLRAEWSRRAAVFATPGPIRHFLSAEAWLQLLWALAGLILALGYSVARTSSAPLTIMAVSGWVSWVGMSTFGTWVFNRRAPAEVKERLTLL